MLAGVDAATIDDPAAYEAWMGRATAKLGSGVSGLIAAETRLGTAQGRVEEVAERQASRATLYSRQINELDGVDPYEAASRMTELDSRLRASYEVTARLQRLSFLDYMR